MEAASIGKQDFFVVSGAVSLKQERRRRNPVAPIRHLTQDEAGAGKKVCGESYRLSRTFLTSPTRLRIGVGNRQRHRLLTLCEMATMDVGCEESFNLTHTQRVKRSTI